MDSLERLHRKTVKMYQCIPDGHKQDVAAEFGASAHYFVRDIIGGNVKSAEAHYRAHKAMNAVALKIFENAKKLLNDLATVEASGLEVVIDE